MTTQSAMRMVEGDHVKSWQASSRDHPTGIFGSHDMAVEDLRFLMERNRLDSSGSDHTGKIPSRSGSAPPSMEGSFAALRNLLKHQEGSFSRSIENYGSEEEIRSDPGYVAYYLSNINLNPRLPPPLISRENQHLLRHLGGDGNNLSPTASWDDMGVRSSLLASRTALSTHREEPEDEASSGEQLTFASLPGRRKSFADIIQRPHSAGNHPTAEDIHAISSGIASERTRRVPESDISVVNLLRETDSLSMEAIASEDPFTSELSSQSSTNTQNERSNARVGSREDNNLSAFGASGPSSAASRMRGNQEEPRRMPVQYTPSSYQVQATSPQQMTYPRMGGGTHDMMQNLPRIATGEVHSSFQSPHGLASPPMYTSTAAYMTSLSPFYNHNFQSSGMYLPQYGYSGYPPASGVVPQYMSGYPSHEATVPMPYDISSPSSGYNNSFSRGSFSPTAQNTPLVDPFQLQYYQHAQAEAYAPSFDSFGKQDQQAAGFMANQEPHSNPLSPSFGLQSPRHMGNYFAVPPGVRVMQQYPGSPLASPVMPSSPVGGGMMSHFGRRSDTRYHHQQGPSRNTGIYPGGWQGNRGGASSSSVDDFKRHSFLDELKSPNARKMELSDITGRVIEFSVDQHGSRFIQQKLEHCSDEEKASVFSEVLPQASKLMTDVFGNYVIQKFIEYGTPAQREELVKQLAGQMVSLSLQMYGCRVIQKALEVIDVDQKTELTLEELNRGETRQTERRLCVCVRKQQMSISMALFSPPISSPLQNSNLLPKIPLSLLSTKRLSLVSLTRASSENGTSTPVSATTVEAPTPKPASVEEVPVKSPAESPSASENGAVGGEEIDDMTTTTMTEIKFQDAKWVNGTWDLKQFEKEGKTDWDSVIVAEAKRRKWLEDNPETTSNDEPVLFDTSIIPWWAWMKRYHLPEAELLNGRAAMVGFFMAYFVDSLTGVGLVDQMGNFFCKTLLFVAVAGVLFIRKNEDLDKLKGLIEETTLYDKQWQAAWKEPESSSSSTVSSKK